MAHFEEKAKLIKDKPNTSAHPHEHLHLMVHKHDEDYNQFKIPPNWELAQKHANARAVSKEKVYTGEGAEPEICQCCGYQVEREKISICSKSIELANVGSGFPLFYNFVFYCILILMVMLCSSGIYNLITNYHGEFCKKSEEVTNAEEELEMCALNWMSLFSLPNKINDPESMRIQNILSLVSVMIIIVILMIFRRNQRKIDAEIDESILSPADYTIMVQNIPTMRNCNYDEELKEFFTKTVIPGKELHVTKVNLVYDTEEIEEIEKEIDKTIREKQGELEKDPKFNPDEFNIKLEKLENEVKEACLRAKTNPEYFAGLAFISFHTEDEKREVINESKTKIIHRVRDILQGSKLYRWHGYIKNQGVFFRGYRLLIKEAPEPNDINWESIHSSNFDKFLVRCKTFTIWTLILAFGFGVIFLLKYYQEVYLDGILEELKEGEHGDKVEIKMKIDRVVGFAVLMAFLIICFNKFAVGTAIDYLVEIEKISTKTRLHLGFASKLSLCLFFNTALISLIIDILIFKNYYHYGGLIFVESCVVIIDIGFDLIIWIVDPYTLIKKWKRSRAMAKKDKCTLTQKQANILMEMPGYHISERYADLIKTMWFVFLYGNLIPLSIVMFVCYLIFFYWIDRYNLLRRRCVKETISLELSTHMVESLEWIIPIYGIGNYLFAANLFNNNHDYYAIAILIIGILYIVLPMGMINEYIFPVSSEDESVFYQIAAENFETDYDRENPVTKHHSLIKWREMKQSFFKQKSLNASPTKPQKTDIN